MRAMTRPQGRIGWDGQRPDKTPLLLQALTRPTLFAPQIEALSLGRQQKHPPKKQKKSPASQGFVGRDVEPVAVVLARTGVWVRVP